MSMIQVRNLTFGYEGNVDNIFEDVSFNIDTDWKLGLIGRNGKGKTTFLNLLLGKYEFSGSIIKTVDVDYFPFEINNKKRMTLDIIEEIIPSVEDWKIIKELNLLNTNPEILYKDFSVLSGGEQVKVLLVSLFLKENNFLLIDEPTNHLDTETKDNLAEYLKRKNGFIIVSHDRDFLDKVVDHIISINNSNIEIQKGNFSSWKENLDRQNNFELTQNEKIQKDINRLEIASRNTANWSDKVEKTKYGTKNSGSKVDRGYIGHQAAKMMKKSKVMEKRIEKAIEEKSNLLKNIDRNDELVIKPLENNRKSLIIADKLQIKYNDKAIFDKISFDINSGERVAIVGKNGIGKTSLLKLFLKENIEFNGTLKIINDIKISYVPQHTEELRESLKELALKNNIEESILKAMLSKMGFSKEDFNRKMENLSEGQKKKVLIAKSITENANLYIWDEPLNYIDILTRIQIEEAILKYKPTIIFIEHDKTFVKNVATKIINLKN